MTSEPTYASQPNRWMSLRRMDGSGKSDTGDATSRIVVGSPMGPLVVAGNDTSVTRLSFPHPGTACTAMSPGPGPVPLRQAGAQLDDYFCGRRTTFDLPLAPAGTPFQRSVWLALAGIGYGERITYAELARWVGRPTALRAVGQAVGANPLPIFYPCHRVVASDGGLGGYSGGPAAKQQLLTLEGWPSKI